MHSAKKFLDTLKQYSEIPGRLKHPFSVTPTDRYSLTRQHVQNSGWPRFYIGAI